MLKNIEYNKEYRIIRGKSIYQREFDLLHEFLATDHENIRLEYSNEKEASLVRNNIFKYINRCKMPLEVMRRGVFVFAVRVSKETDGE